MLYLVTGLFRSGSDPKAIALHDEFNDHLGQASDKIRLFGLLRGRDGRRKGYMALIEAENFDEAENFLKQSPFYENDLYERVEVAEFTAEVGALEKA